MDCFQTRLLTADTAELHRSDHLRRKTAKRSDEIPEIFSSLCAFVAPTGKSVRKFTGIKKSATRTTFGSGVRSQPQRVAHFPRRRTLFTRSAPLTPGTPSPSSTASSPRICSFRPFRRTERIMTSSPVCLSSIPVKTRVGATRSAFAGGRTRLGAARPRLARRAPVAAMAGDSVWSEMSGVCLCLTSP